MRRIRRHHPQDLPPVRRRELAAWACYDFANSGYTTVVITAIFNAYFVAVVAGGAAWGTFAWTAALSVSYAIVLITAPLLGAWTDLRARKKPALALATIVCVLATAGLAGCGPGEVALAVVLVVVSNAAFGTGENLVAAFLPELAEAEGMGRLSGYAWALGYIGGLVVLGLCLAWIQGASGRGTDTASAVRDSMLITAGLFALAAVPTLWLLRERARPAPASVSVWPVARERLRAALHGSDGLVDLRRFLVCILFYQAGVGTVITIAAIYTQQQLGFSTEDSIRLILVVNVGAAIGAFGFGWLQDRIGHRAALAGSLVLWLVAIGVLFASESRPSVWLASNLAGLALGASQSAARALVGILCPPAREGEVFGLWGLAVKGSMILGPLSYGVISFASGGNHRLAMLATGGFFVLGLLLLARVDVSRGRAAAFAAAPVQLPR